MQQVRVIAPMGATLRGPATVHLTKEQHGRRGHVLGKLRRDGVYALDGDQALTFKYGEELGVVQAEGRLNRQLFEPVVADDPDGQAAASGGAGSPDGQGSVPGGAAP